MRHTREGWRKNVVRVLIAGLVASMVMGMIEVIYEAVAGVGYLNWKLQTAGEPDFRPRVVRCGSVGSLRR